MPELTEEQKKYLIELAESAVDFGKALSEERESVKIGVGVRFSLHRNDGVFRRFCHTPPNTRLSP